MVKIYFSLILGIFLIGDLGAQAPVMNPITGASVVCSAPSAANTYSASASNSPTSYSWTVLPSAGVVIGTPTNSTTTIDYPYTGGSYTVVCYTTNGSGTSAPVTFVVNVFETPNVTFSGATSFCQGSSTNISASSTMLSASPTFSWSPPTGLSTTVGQFVSASPTTITTYTVLVSTGFCSNTGTITITPNPSPTITAIASSTLICPGDAVSIFPSGASSYTINSTWLSGLPVGFPFNPPISSAYFINGTNAFGCNGSTTLFINVFPAPTIFVTATPSLACMGQSVALTFGGTSTSFSINGVTCGSSVAISPTVNTTYTITGASSFGCKVNFPYTQYIGCIGVNNLAALEIQGLSVYPNPSAGEFNLSSGKDEAVKIVNELGQLIKNFELKANTLIMIRDLAHGVYFVMSNDTRIKIVVLQ